MHLVEKVFRFAGAARQGEVRIVDRCPKSIMHVEQNFTDFIMHVEQIITDFITHVEQTVAKYGEGAPAHISAASARRRGLTLAIKLPSCCEVAQR